MNFGDYAQVHVSAESRNSSDARTVGAITLYPSENGQDSWYFMSLATGKRIHAYSWTVMPIGQDVIDIVQNIAQREEYDRGERQM